MEVFDLLYLLMLPSLFLLTLCGLYGLTVLVRLPEQKEKAPTKCQSQRFDQIENGKVAQPTKATNFSAQIVD